MRFTVVKAMPLGNHIFQSYFNMKNNFEILIQSRIMLENGQNLKKNIGIRTRRHKSELSNTVDLKSSTASIFKDKNVAFHLWPSPQKKSIKYRIVSLYTNCLI